MNWKMAWLRGSQERNAGLDLQTLRNAARQAAAADQAAQDLGAALARAEEPPHPEDPVPVWVAALALRRDRASDWLGADLPLALLEALAAAARHTEARMAAATHLHDPEALERVARLVRHADNAVYRLCTQRLGALREARRRLASLEALATAVTQLEGLAPVPVNRLVGLERVLADLAGAMAADGPVETSKQAPSQARAVEEQATDAPAADAAPVVAPEPVIAPDIEAGAVEVPTVAGPDAETLRRGLALRLEALSLRVREEADALRTLQQMTELAARLLLTPGMPGSAAALDSLEGGLAALPLWCREHARGRTLTTQLAELRAMPARPAPVSEPAPEPVAEIPDGSPADATGHTDGLDSAIAQAAMEENAAASAAASAAAGQVETGANPAGEAGAIPGGIDPAGTDVAPITDAPEAAIGATPAPQAACAVPGTVQAAGGARQKAQRSSEEKAQRRAEHAPALAAVEAALEAGQLQAAEAALAGLDPADCASDGGPEAARWQQCAARLTELRGWARWGAQSRRNELLVRARGLLEQEMPPQDLAREIPALREVWNQLNAQFAATRGQRERFEAALRAAHVPVAAWRAEQAQARAAALQAREALLQALEGALTRYDGSATEAATAPPSGDDTAGVVESEVAAPGPATTLRELEQARQRFQQAWRQPPMAAPGDERRLRKRADKALARIESLLGGARRGETAHREALVTAAQELAASAAEARDLRGITDQMKALQERWKQETGTVPLARGIEQALWKRFRAACDEVFNRRDAARDAHQAERKAQHVARDQQLAALATALETPADLSALRSARTQFQKAWQEQPGNVSAAQDRRARELEAGVQQALGQARTLQWRERLEQRLARAQAAAAPGDIDRPALLLDLEIALEIPSPRALEEARRERRIVQLRDRFRAAGPAASGAAASEELLVSYHTGLVEVPAGDRDRLAQVIERLGQLAQREARSDNPRPAAPSAGNARRPQGPGRGNGPRPTHPGRAR
jgi:hypothetical protein